MVTKINIKDRVIEVPQTEDGEEEEEESEESSEEEQPTQQEPEEEKKGKSLFMKGQPLVSRKSDV